MLECGLREGRGSTEARQGLAHTASGPLEQHCQCSDLASDKKTSECCGLDFAVAVFSYVMSSHTQETRPCLTDIRPEGYPHCKDARRLALYNFHGSLLRGRGESWEWESQVISPSPFLVSTTSFYELSIPGMVTDIN